MELEAKIRPTVLLAVEQDNFTYGSIEKYTSLDYIAR